MIRLCPWALVGALDGRPWTSYSAGEKAALDAASGAVRVG